MPDSAVIQEFLVSLGFKLDDSQRRKFDAALGSNRKQAEALNKILADTGKQLGILGDQLIKVSGRPSRENEEAVDRINKRHVALIGNVKSLGLQAKATAVTFVAGFAGIAREYQSLYYISQRTGVSAQQLAALKFAGPQVGLGAGDLIAATEALATAVRNPGIKNMVESWGVASTDLQGIIRHLAALPPYLQDAYAGMLGISNTTLRNLINNQAEFAKAQRDFDRNISNAGINYKKFTGDAVEVTRQLETAWSKLGLIGIQGFEEVYPAAHKLLGEVDLLLDEVLKFNKAHPGAAFAENLAAATVSATAILATLGKVSGLPLLRYGIIAGALYGTYKGAESFGNPKDKGHPYGQGWTGDNPVWDARNVFRRLANLGNTDPYSHIPGTTSWIKGLLGFAGGGIVPKDGPIVAHANEMVLPPAISQGFQAMLSGSGGGSGGGILSTFATSFRSWLGGSTAYHPVVQVLGLDTNALNQFASLGLVGSRDAGGRMTSALRPDAGNRSAAGGSQASTGMTGSSSSIPAGGDEEMARKAIEQSGGNSYAQAGLLANFYAESGLRRDKPGPGGDFGWAQWIGSRKKALFAYANANNISPYSAEAQAGYLRQELTSNPQFKNMIQRMNASGSSTAAAVISGFTFEQGGAAPHLFGGGSFDQDALDRFHSKGAESIYNRIAKPPETASPESSSKLPSLSPDYVFGDERGRWATDPVSKRKYWQEGPHRPDPNSPWLKGQLGGEGNVTVNHDAGDRNTNVNQTNNFYGGSRNDHSHTIAHLDRHASRLLRNARTSIT